MIVAAYNEADLIARTLAALARAFPDASIWVADDGSSDATSELARQAGAYVVRSTRMIGKGAAVSHAAEAACSHVRATTAPGDPSIFVLCDGDLGDSAARLAPLVEALARDQADVAVAAFARRVGGGVGLALGFARWAIHRRSGLSTRAPISGQRALRGRALEDVLPFAHGFGMEIGMTVDAVRAGYRVVEIELDLDHRASGRTLAGFLHRGRQLIDFVRVYLARR